MVQHMLMISPYGERMDCKQTKAQPGTQRDADSDRADDLRGESHSATDAETLRQGISAYIEKSRNEKLMSRATCLVSEARSLPKGSLRKFA